MNGCRWKRHSKNNSSNRWQGTSSWRQISIWCGWGGVFLSQRWFQLAAKDICDDQISCSSFCNYVTSIGRTWQTWDNHLFSPFKFHTSPYPHLTNYCLEDTCRCCSEFFALQYRSSLWVVGHLPSFQVRGLMMKIVTIPEHLRSKHMTMRAIPYLRD